MGRVVEIDETQLAALQNTTKIVQGMLQDPKTRNKVLSAYKEKYPNVHVPEIDGAAPIINRVEGIEKAVMDFIAEERASRDKKEVEDQVRALKQAQAEGRKLLKQRGYTDEGIKQVEEFRDTKGLVDYGDAVRLWELDNPPPQVNDPSGLGGMSFLDAIRSDADQNDFHKNLFDSHGQADSLVEREARNVIAELRGAGSRR